MANVTTPNSEDENPAAALHAQQQRHYYNLNRDRIRESNKARMRKKRSQPTVALDGNCKDGEAIERVWASVNSRNAFADDDMAVVPREAVYTAVHNTCFPQGSDAEDSDDIDFPDLDPPPIPGDLRRQLNWSHWPKWSAEQRLAAIRRWVMYAELKYCSPLDQWARNFDAAFQYGEPLDDDATKEWRRGQAMVIAGQKAVGYLGRVMEGELPADDDVLRDVYVQALQLSALLHRAISGLQHRLDFAQRSWYK